MNCRRKLKILVMVSGKESPQIKALKTAIDTHAHPELFEVDYISLATAKKRGWTSEQFCEFVKDCDIFIFTCHPVQGDVPPPWNFLQHLRDLYDALEAKIVFPKREALLEDSIFRQDKAQLHETLKDFMSPSIKIDRPADDFTFDEPTLKIIYEFASKNYETHPKNGVGAWHVKAGFSTAGRGNKKAYTIKQIPRKASQVFRKYGLWSVPYVQVERTYANSVEGRAFFLSDPLRGKLEGPFMAHPHIRGNGRSFSFAPHTKLAAFATKVKKVLEERCPNVCSYPVIRIDVFITQLGELIVNEVESLEAYIPAAGKGRHDIDQFSQNFINEFWKHRLEYLLLLAVDYVNSTECTGN